MINGNSLVVQLGSESVYGTLPAAMNHRVKVSAEGFKWTPNKKDEGLLTGGKSVGKVETMSIKVAGSLSCLARPDDVGFFLKHALGVEAEPATSGTSAFKHTFSAIGNELTDSLASFSAILDRKADIIAYTGCKISTLAFSAAAEDFLKIEVGVIGREETCGAPLTSGLVASSLRAFKFRHGKVKLAGIVVADITSIKYNHDNKMDNSIQTTGTGKYFVEPECGAREITAEVEVLYGTIAEQFRKDYFKTDNLFSIELAFTSDDLVETDVPYSMTIRIPHAQVKDYTGNVSGAEATKATLPMLAVEDGSDPLIEIDLVNAQATAY